MIGSDGSNKFESSMFECSKPKIGIWIRFSKGEHDQCQFQVCTVQQTVLFGMLKWSSHTYDCTWNEQSYFYALG